MRPWRRMRPVGRSMISPARGRAMRVPSRTSRRTVISGTRARPAPFSTTRLIVSMLSNSLTSRTAGAQHLDDAVGTGVLQVDVHVGIEGDEAGEMRRQGVQADAVNRGDTDGAGDLSLQLAEPGLQRLRMLEDLARALVERLAGLGRLRARAAAAPLQEHPP